MATGQGNSFGSRGPLRAGQRDYQIFRIGELEKRGLGQPSRLPFSLKVLLENLLRQEDGSFVKAADIEALSRWNPAKTGQQREVNFMPARVLMQDFTGVPAVVDLAAMRDAMRAMGGDPKKINPLLPVDLVIDHSVQVDVFGNGQA